MLRLAVLETEPCAKDLIFAIAKSLNEWEWTFAHFTRISAFAKADVKQPFDILFMNELFHTPRVFASFIDHHPARIVIFCMNEGNHNHIIKRDDKHILYLNRGHIKEEMKRLEVILQMLLQAHKEYVFSYQNVRVALRMQDIVYIEKQDKNLIFHTNRGIFKERQTMTQAETTFARFDFLRIHSGYIINAAHVTSVNNDEVILDHELCLPIARARRNAVSDWSQRYIKPMAHDTEIHGINQDDFVTIS